MTIQFLKENPYENTYHCSNCMWTGTTPHKQCYCPNCGAELFPVEWISPNMEEALKAERIKLLIELYEALPLHESIDSLRFTLLRSEAGDEIKRRASVNTRDVL